MKPSMKPQPKQKTFGKLHLLYQHELESYGHLLDSIELVDRRLAALKRKQSKIPPQVLPLTIVFKQLLRFIKDSGIHPLDSTGREFMAEAEDLSGCTYIGEPFSYEGEKRNLLP